MKFDYHSPRSRKARLTVKLGGFTRRLMRLFEISGFILGLLLLLQSEPAGWLALAIAIFFTMMLWWWKAELHRLDPINGGEKIDDQLASNILGRLKENPTSIEIAEIVSSVSGGRFIAQRFGVGKTSLESLVEIKQNTPAKIWQTAMQIQKKLKTNTVSGGVLALAIVKNYPNHDQLLAQYSLSFEDLEEGVLWHDHIFSLIDRHGQPVKTGGIARDWSFGYTPIIDRFGRTIGPGSVASMSSNLEQHHDLVDKMIDQFTASGKQNIALIGPDGAGKTTVVQAFAEKILDGDSKISNRLKFHQVVMLDAGALIAAAPGRGELEGLLNQIMVEAYAAKNIILCLDNAQLFFEEAIGSVDLSNLLLPVLEAGSLRMVLTMDEQRFLQISSRNPSVANSLNRLQVKPANFKETLAVMQDKIIFFEHQYKVLYMYQALRSAYDLSKRYIFDLEMPGRAVKLLETAASYADKGVVTALSVERAIEDSMNVKVTTATVSDEREKLLNLEQLLHERVIGQDQAISAVANALRRARSGVGSQSRPIGTFLFLGPTGVGKTELAKALAEVYFGGEENLIRLDLNEYVNLSDVERLIADGADNPNSLTAQVMKKPFSVILLDEIEKAHPNVLTALLQLLDEGVMRDIKNREVYFRDAIIIATSNAGADRIRELIDRGYEVGKFESQLIDDLISSNQFRPEFLNRFDEVTVFAPLLDTELAQIVDLMIGSINKTLAGQKITVVVDEAAKRRLIEVGHDPRLGARPMRRSIQKVVENTVARKLLSGEAAIGSEIVITPDVVDQSLG